MCITRYIEQTANLIRSGYDLVSSFIRKVLNCVRIFSNIYRILPVDRYRALFEVFLIVGVWNLAFVKHSRSFQNQVIIFCFYRKKKKKKGRFHFDLLFC